MPLKEPNLGCVSFEKMHPPLLHNFPKERAAQSTTEPTIDAWQVGTFLPSTAFGVRCSMPTETVPRSKSQPKDDILARFLLLLWQAKRSLEKRLKLGEKLACRPFAPVTQ
jgi:hypothetical protein